jgi:hypothetical protein
MKMVKSLLLGSAAGVVAIAGAQAADLPVKAPPVAYVKICSLYGVGFYYVPGTDMCLKVGGWARYETGTGYNGSFTFEWFDNNSNNRAETNWHQRAKGNITMDARDQTAYGTVRSYIDVGVSTNTTGQNEGAQVANYMNRWFIQWAGFTIGHSTSFYDFYSIGANQYGVITGSSDTGDGGWTVFGYTAQFGNGLSASLSAESQRYTRLVRDTSTFVFNQQGANYAAQQMPDVVGNIRVEQAWGSAQIMGAWHEIIPTYYNPAGTDQDGNPANASGFAVGAGLKLNAPFIGMGDYFQAEVDYTQGASRYSNATALAWDWTAFDGNTFGFGYETDGVFAGNLFAGNTTGIELTTTWAVNAAYTHFWNPAWKSTLFGAYRAVSYPGLANAILCTGIGGGNGVGGTGSNAVAAAGCDMDWSTWGVGLRTEWAVSHTFQIGLEVLYAKLQSASTFNNLIDAVALGAGTNKPAGPYTVSDQDNWSFRFRVNRTFYP